MDGLRRCRWHVFSIDPVENCPRRRLADMAESIPAFLAEQFRTGPLISVATEGGSQVRWPRCKSKKQHSVTGES